MESGYEDNLKLQEKIDDLVGLLAEIETNFQGIKEKTGWFANYADVLEALREYAHLVFRDAAKLTQEASSQLEYRRELTESVRDELKLKSARLRFRMMLVRKELFPDQSWKELEGFKVEDSRHSPVSS